MSSRRVDGTVIVTAPGDIEPGHRFRVVDEETIGFIPREGRPPTADERAGLPLRKRLLAERLLCPGIVVNENGAIRLEDEQTSRLG